MADLLTLPPIILYPFIAIVGLCIGSFLNVVIYRLPHLLQYQWQQECRMILNLPSTKTEKPLNLIYPRSQCPACHQILRTWHLIPVLGFCLLRGKCAYCDHKIALRYPIVEILTALLSLFIISRYGVNSQAFALLVLTWALIALALIDFDYQLLPDVITLPLLWLGLLLNSFVLFTHAHDAIFGAAIGYSSLWLIAKLFKVIRAKEGMGQGDFKLFAVFGAWLGWQPLPLVILCSALLGLIAGGIMIATTKLTKETPIPFGPYLAIGGWLILILNPYLERIINI